MFDLNIKRNCGDCDYLFLPNLRWATDTPKYIVPMHEHLKNRLGKVGMYLTGEDMTEEKAFRSLYDQWEVMKHPLLIVGNARLYQKALMTFPVGKVVSYWQILADYGLPPAPHTHTNHFKPSLVFDPWYFRDDKSIQMYAREIMMMSNYDEAEDADNSCKECETEEEYKAAFVKIAKGSKKPIVTYCNNCRDFLAGQGIPVIHLLDMIFSHTEKETQNHPPFTAEEKAANINVLKAEIATN